MSKLPFMKFYPGDWLSDVELRFCSLEAKGLLIDLICLMWKSPTRGKLIGTYKQLSRQVGITEKAFVKIMSELISNKVLNIAHSGVKKTLFSRRMVRDEKSRNNKSLTNKNYYEKHN